MAPRKAASEKAASSSSRSNREEASSKIPTFKFVVLGTVLAVAFLSSAYYSYQNYIVNQLQIPHLHTLSDRFTFVLRYQVFGLAVILLLISQIATTRLFTNSRNPLSGNEQRIEKASRILQNTVEQFLLNFVNQLILVTYLTENQLKLIPVINLIFLIGRLTFYLGYLISPDYRTFGFMVTFIPNLAMLGYNSYFLATRPSFLIGSDVPPRSFASPPSPPSPGGRI